MLFAILASALLLNRSVFSFQEDKGIIYVRSFSMDQNTFYVTQTNLRTGAEEVTAMMSVAGLHYCTMAMLSVSIACLLCFFSNRWRMVLCMIVIVLAGAYYLLLIYYAIEITGEHYTTMYPNLWAILPAIVLQMMILVRQNVARTIMAENEDEEQAEE